tara:strand:+ start:1141 stop:1638 length:498 start_codon:yes stop_codon:yes gene_type:complete
MTNVYELSASFESIAKQIEAGSLTEEEAADTIESMSILIKQKCEGVTALILNADADVEQLKKARDKINARIKSKESFCKRMKGLLQGAMEATKTISLESPQFKIQLVDNPPSVELVEDAEKLLKEEYIKNRVIRTPDKIKIKEDLKRGIEIPGAQLVTKRRVRIT